MFPPNKLRVVSARATRCLTRATLSLGSTSSSVSAHQKIAPNCGYIFVSCGSEQNMRHSAASPTFTAWVGRRFWLSRAAKLVDANGKGPTVCSSPVVVVSVGAGVGVGVATGDAVMPSEVRTKISVCSRGWARTATASWHQEPGAPCSERQPRMQGEKKRMWMVPFFVWYKERIEASDCCRPTRRPSTTWTLFPETSRVVLIQNAGDVSAAELQIVQTSTR